MWFDFDEGRWFTVPRAPAVGLGDPDAYRWMPLKFGPFLAEWFARGVSDEQVPFPMTATLEGVEEVILRVRVGDAFAHGTDTARYEKAVVSIQPVAHGDLPRDATWT